MTAIPLVRVAAVLPFVSFLEEIGAPLEALWDETRLSWRALLDPEELVPLELASAFVENAARSQGIEHLGLVVARHVGGERLGGLARMLDGPATLERALARLGDTVRRHSSGVHHWAVCDGDVVRIRQRWRLRAERFRQLDLFSVALLIDLVRRVAGDGWRPDAVDLQSAGPLEFADDESFAAARLRAGQASTGLAVPRHLLRRVLRPATSPGSAGRPQTRRGAPPADLVGSMMVAIRATLVPGGPDLDTVARTAGISARSLQRCLRDAGTSFTELVDRARREHAVALLESSRMKIVEIAFELGYSDAAHFSRAFRRWTATTPYQHRDRHRTVAALRRSA